MSLTLDTLSERLTNVELEVGAGHNWSRQENAVVSEDKSLVHEIAVLQEKVERIFHEHAELRGLPEIIKRYREDQKPLGAGIGKALENREPSSSTSELRPSVSEAGEISNAQKQESVLIQYPSIMECYNLLVEFSAMDIPAFSSELCDQLRLEPFLSKRPSCETIARKFHLLVVKSLVIIEEFTAMIKHQAVFSQNIDKRMQVLSSKLASLERKKQAESKY